MPSKEYNQLSEEEKARRWSKTYHELQLIGFSEKEAEWAANRGFSMKESIMKRIIDKRKWDIRIYKLRLKKSRDEAIELLSREVNIRNQAMGLEDEDLFNILRVVYP